MSKHNNFERYLKMAKKCSECTCFCYDVGLRFAKCLAPENIDKGRMEALKLVGMDNPPAVYRLNYASMQRETGWFLTRLDNRCGKEGRWFKPKERKNEKTSDNRQ